MATHTGSKAEVATVGLVNNVNFMANSQSPYAISVGEFKRDYEFIWSIHFPNFSDKSLLPLEKIKARNSYDVTESPKMDMTDEHRVDWIKKIVRSFVGTSQFAWTYISRQAKDVKLPDVELEEEEVDVGIYQHPIPVKVKYGTFSVTYLDDLFETVWNAHQNWLQLVGSGLVPISLCCLEADYWTTTGAVLALVEQLFPTLKPIIELVASGDLYLATSNSHYKLIYPIKVSRSDASKEGSGLSTVTVEYKQMFIPKYQCIFSSMSDEMVLGGYDKTSYEYMLAKLLGEESKLNPIF